jgi:hypothetical protein
VIAVVALRYADPGARLAARPRGVPHVVPAGPDTPSGRYVPRATRPLCRAHTRRLTVLPPGGCETARVCARCAASLTSPTRVAAPRTRDDYRARFTGLTGRHLTAAVTDARTAVEVDQAAHLTLLLYGVVGCRKPDPATGRSLHDHVHDARSRLVDDTTRAARKARTGHAADATRRHKAELWDAREQRAAQIGINNARPHPARTTS